MLEMNLLTVGRFHFSLSRFHHFPFSCSAVPFCSLHLARFYFLFLENNATITIKTALQYFRGGG